MHASDDGGAWGGPRGRATPAPPGAVRVARSMNRLKFLAFVLGLSIVSAVTLRLLLDPLLRERSPEPAVVVEVDSLEVDRRLVGCGHLHFVFDSLGYRSGQWPVEVDDELAARRLDALVRAHEGEVVAVFDDAPSRRVGEYRIRTDTADVTLGQPPGGLRARLGAVGDSLGGVLERATADGGWAVVGRLFLSTPVPPPAACSLP